MVRWTTQGFTTARSQRSARQGPANREETVSLSPEFDSERSAGLAAWLFGTKKGLYTPQVEEALKLWGELFQSSEAAEPVKAKSSSGIVMPTVRADRCAVFIAASGLGLADLMR